MYLCGRSYSDFNAFTGFIKAAFMVWKPTVSNVMNSTMTAENKKVNGLMAV